MKYYRFFFISTLFLEPRPIANDHRASNTVCCYIIILLQQEARSKFSVSSASVGNKGTPRQLVLLLSDGRFDRENKDRLRKLVREMNERGQLLVLIGERSELVKQRSWSRALFCLFALVSWFVWLSVISFLRIQVKFLRLISLFLQESSHFTP